MARAIDPKRVTNIVGVATAFKKDAKNVILDLNTARFLVKNNATKPEVIKEIKVEKGYDAIYVLNRSTNLSDIKSSGEFLANQRAKMNKSLSELEVKFADTQESLTADVINWRSLSPGTAKTTLALNIGHKQKELASIEHEMRNTQYTYRLVLQDNEIKRRTYVPSSFDDRKTDFPVYCLKQYMNASKDRVVPIK